jgi:hypothetical protein
MSIFPIEKGDSNISCEYGKLDNTLEQYVEVDEISAFVIQTFLVSTGNLIIH